MFSDVVGYTAIMGRDEQQALRALEDHRELLRLLLPKFNGRMVGEIGDGTLTSFHSAIDAVNCAREEQANLQQDQPVCGELLICVENQQFATHNLGTRPFKATRLPRSASEVFVSSFVFRLVFFVGCKKPRLKTASFRCVLNWR